MSLLEARKIVSIGTIWALEERNLLLTCAMIDLWEKRRGVDSNKMVKTQWRWMYGFERDGGRTSLWDDG